jgi:hypothetical protein
MEFAIFEQVADVPLYERIMARPGKLREDQVPSIRRLSQ